MTIPINVTEEINYTEESGLSNGHVTIRFGNLPEVHFVLQALSKFCDKVRGGKLQTFVAGKPEEPKKEEKGEKEVSGETKIFQADEPKKKRIRERFDGTLPKISSGHVSSWEYKSIKATIDLDDVMQDHHRKFPNSVLTKEQMKEIWVYYHPKANAKREMEKPAERTEADPAPGVQIGIGSKVVQVNGFSPAAGIGTVMSIKKGECKVQFFNHIKVLPMNSFALATEADIMKAKRVVNNV